MASQDNSKPTKPSDTSSSAPPAESPEKEHSDSNITKETHNASRKSRKRFLSHEEAEAGGPADIAACGEEDPGVALEWMVEDPEEKDSQ